MLVAITLSLLLTAGTIGTAGALAAASGEQRAAKADSPPRPSTNPIVVAAVDAIREDCAAHRNTLTVRHSRAVLRRGYRELRGLNQLWTPCGLAVASQRNATTRSASRSRSARTVYRDCLYNANGGALRRHYAPATLRAAFRRMPAAIRTETNFPIGIASQYNAVRRAGSARLVAPRRRGDRGARLPTATVADTVARLATTYTAFARPRDAQDTLPDWAAGSLPTGDPAVGIDPTQARVLGADGDLVVVPGRGRLHLVLRIVEGGVQKATVSTFDETLPAQLSFGISRAPGGWLLTAANRVGTRGVRVFTAGGTWQSIRARRDALLHTVRHVPRLITWRDRTGAQHYLDFTSAYRG
ncbi:MAG: hypothetical protein AB7G37_14600 [Solirubrobacteraceae bacterium]